MAIEGVFGTGLEAQSSQTDAVKSLIRWESPHPLSIAGVDILQVRRKRINSARSIVRMAAIGASASPPRGPGGVALPQHCGRCRPADGAAAHARLCPKLPCTACQVACVASAADVELGCNFDNMRKTRSHEEVARLAPILFRQGTQ